MPVIEISLVESEKNFNFDYIAGKLTSLTAEILNKDPETTVVILNRVEARTHVKQLGNQNFHCNINIKVTKDTNTKEEKSLWIKAVNHFMSGYFLLSNCENLNYVTIQDISADCWGYSGLTQFSRRNNGD